MLFWKSISVKYVPIFVIGIKRGISLSTIHTTIFVQKTNIRTKFTRRNIEEDINMRIEIEIKNLLHPDDFLDGASLSFVDDKFNEPSIMQNTAHVDFNGKHLDTARFVKVNNLPAVRSVLHQSQLLMML